MAYYRVKVTRDALGRPVEWFSDPEHPNLIFMPRRGGQNKRKTGAKKKYVAKILPFKSDAEITKMPEKQAYTVGEVAELTGLSSRTITRMFENEKGVLILERPESMHKRRYRSIRIPRLVYEQVLRKLTV